MGTWSEKIKDNDTTLDIYSAFFDRYNSGEKPDLISKSIKVEYADYFNDSDDRNNALIGLALAQWETKSLEPDLHKEISDLVKSGKDLIIWKNLGANEKSLKKRKTELDKFLNQISLEKNKAKRRIRPKIEFSTNVLVKAVAPDNKKELVIQEEFGNGKYIHTSGIMTWFSGGGAGIIYHNKLGGKVIANWSDSQTVEIIHEIGLNFTKKETKSYYCGDEVMIKYKEK
ncbi:hypothetical protein [Prolixibacter sp. NT017]|uniref:hypothetical protein n=1 Tax=Prolixibacter sp. NT017 TaxID=2652390 RepID=UPI00128A7970|nr:hypothetical protein [Prolixibacter sp. NT017]GET25185.1 hypothetical protein NT017_15140 [Prolixibacter sp. NT017]